jgi:cobalt-zinc-cadmium efflux system outer membrane protein
MRRNWIFAIVLSANTAAAEPSEVSPELTIDQAVALYKARSPKLAASRSTIEITAADLVDAQIYPNPSIGVSVSNTVHGTPTNGDSVVQGELDVPLLVGKRGQRSEAAHRRVATTTAEVAANQAEGVHEVRRRFVALLAAQEKVAAITAAVEDAHRVRVIVAGRAQAGAKSPYDLERTDLAVATIENRLAEATNDRLVATEELSEAIGIADWHPHAVGTFRPSDLALPTTIDAAHPALARPAAAETQARAEEELAHVEARPTPSLALSGYKTVGPSGVGLTIGLSFPLPLFDRNQGAVARAHANAQSAILERAAAAFELHVALERGSHVLGVRREALTRFEADAIARLPKLRTMAEDAYRSGQGGIVELLDALDAITETRLRDIELIQAVLVTELDLRAAATGQ